MFRESNNESGPSRIVPHGVVVSVSRNPDHTFSKEVFKSIKLLEGLGVEGDAHMGRTVKHRSRVEQEPDQPNLRQVHLIQAELFDELRRSGFNVGPGDIGENITTSGIDLLSLPKDTILTIGEGVAIQLTGLRNPCYQLDGFQEGLMHAVLDRDGKGKIIRKSGVMSIVLKGGIVAPGDVIRVTFPGPPHRELEIV